MGSKCIKSRYSQIHFNKIITKVVLVTDFSTPTETTADGAGTIVGEGYGGLGNNALSLFLGSGDKGRGKCNQCSKDDFFHIKRIKNFQNALRR